MPVAEYSMVDDVQAGHILAAMEDATHLAIFEVTLLPLRSDEQRRAAAEEWSACKLAIGEVRAREMGAFAVFSSRDESPDGMQSPLIEP